VVDGARGQKPPRAREGERPDLIAVPGEPRDPRRRQRARAARMVNEQRRGTFHPATCNVLGLTVVKARLPLVRGALSEQCQEPVGRNTERGRRKPQQGVGEAREYC
jgi:hypothetical protein